MIFNSSTHAPYAQKTPLNFFAIIWALFMFLSPLYIFSKGMPQPADYLIAGFGFPLLIITWLKHKGSVSLVFLFGSLFALLTIFVNLINFYFASDQKLLKHSMYYIYNFCVFMFIVVIYKQNPQRVNQLTYYALAAAIIFEFIYAPLFGPVEVLRNLGTFNNPNQLAYWSLLSMVMLIIVKREKKFSLFDAVLFGMCVFLQSISLSKAGMILAVMVLILILFLPNLSKQGRLFLTLSIFIFTLFQLFEPSAFLKRIEKVEQIAIITMRLENIGQEEDDTAKGRGYTRLLEHPHYLLFGAGEGAYFRFGRGSQEIHSGIATIIFSYGIIGATFFCLFLYHIFKKLPAQYWVLMGIVLMYSLTHQGMRFTYFWVFLAICYVHVFYFKDYIKARTN